MWDLNCLGKRVACYLDAVGLRADVTFKRIDDDASGTYHDMYRERRESDQVYRTWQLKAVIDENPRSNKKGVVGAEIEQDVDFVLYERRASGGSEAGQTYVPQEKDLVDYRDTTYEVTRIERILPTGANSQMSFKVMAKRDR